MLDFECRQIDLLLIHELGSPTINSKLQGRANICTIFTDTFLTKYFYCYKAMFCSLFVSIDFFLLS